MHQPRLTSIVFLLSLLLGIPANSLFAQDDNPPANAVTDAQSGNVAEAAAPKSVSTNGKSVSPQTPDQPPKPQVAAAPIKPARYKVIGQADQTKPPQLSTLGALGGIKGEHPYKMQVEISGYGGSIWHALLSEYTADIVPVEPDLKTDEEKRRTENQPPTRFRKQGTSAVLISSPTAPFPSP